MNAKIVIPTRYVQIVGTDAEVSWHWETNRNDTCKYGHRASLIVASSEKPQDTSIGGTLSDYYDRKDLTPNCCERCGDPTPLERVSISMGWRQRYNTPSGRPEPGDFYFVNMHEPNEDCLEGWTNCDGKHLHAVCPNGGHWDIDSRANNCTMRNDTLHRCWIRHGKPWENPAHVLHVDKNGLTCQAGAGSIIYGNWHGFLHHGTFREC